MKKILLLTGFILVSLLLFGQYPAKITKFQNAAFQGWYPNDGTAYNIFTGRGVVHDTLQVPYIDSVGTLRFSDGSSMTKALTLGYIDLVVDYGADTTGNIDITNILSAAAQVGKAIYLRNGFYKLSNTVWLPDSVTIYGQSARTIINVGNNSRGLLIKSHTNIYNISFHGTRNTGGTNQTGITTDSASVFQIRNCYFRGLAGAGISVMRTNFGGAGVNGSLIDGCRGDSNTMGMKFTLQGEYVTVANCIFNANDTALFMAAGNISIVGGIYNYNTYGIWIKTSTNGAHSVCTGAMINHNAGDAIRCDSVGLGYRFVGCAIYFGAVRVISSDGIVFQGCDYQPSTTQVLSSTNTAITNCRVSGGLSSLDTSKVAISTILNGSTYTLDKRKGTNFAFAIDSNNVDFIQSGVDSFSFKTANVVVKENIRVDSALYLTSSKIIAYTPYVVTDGDLFLEIDATAANATVNLPTGLAKGRVIHVQQIDASGNTVTIDGNGNTINGAATLVISTQWTNYMLYWNGTAWRVK